VTRQSGYGPFARAREAFGISLEGQAVDAVVAVHAEGGAVLDLIGIEGRTAFSAVQGAGVCRVARGVVAVGFQNESRRERVDDSVNGIEEVHEDLQSIVELSERDGDVTGRGLATLTDFDNGVENSHGTSKVVCLFHVFEDTHDPTVIGRKDIAFPCFDAVHDEFDFLSERHKSSPRGNRSGIEVVWKRVIFLPVHARKGILLFCWYIG